MKKNSILINNKEDGDGKMLQNCQKTPKICHLSFVLYNIKVEGWIPFVYISEGEFEEMGKPFENSVCISRIVRGGQKQKFVKMDWKNIKFSTTAEFWRINDYAQHDFL